MGRARQPIGAPAAPTYRRDVLDHIHAPADETPRANDNFRALDERAVLLAYDGSVPAKASILEAAHRLGTDRCAIVLTVWHPRSALAFSGAVRLAPPDTQRSIEVTATRIAYEGARLARSIGFDARPIVASGDAVWRCIVDAADAHDASIVVLGSGETGSAGLMLTGRVAVAVASHTTRPVLIVEAASAGRSHVVYVVNDRQECTWIRRARSRATSGWCKLTACLNQRRGTITPHPHPRSFLRGTARNVSSIVWRVNTHSRRRH
jgi:nucleotide-binding universal stress UspA family protein